MPANHRHKLDRQTGAEQFGDGEMPQVVEVQVFDATGAHSPREDGTNAIRLV